MPNPQPGLFALGLSAHQHIEFALRDGVSDDEIRDAIAKARLASSWLGGPNVTFGFAPAVWSSLNPSDTPADLQPFPGIEGTDGLSAPATQWDIWVWCSSSSREAVDSTADFVRAALGGIADPALEVAAYTLADSRDPTGFIDGTENPLLDEAMAVSLYPEGTPGAGGSSVLLQKWVHKMDAFDALTIPEQEDVIGRTKPDSTQISDDAMPPTSHVSRNTIVDDDGNERHIFRRNTPFKSDDETGTQFIGCTNDTGLIMLMEDRMFGVTSDGLIDNLTKFSTPVSGSWYFVPSMESLGETFGLIGQEPEPAPSPARDSSLGIGSLLSMASESAQRFAE